MKTLSGLLMITKYVKNWYTVLAIFSNLKESTIVVFKDGTHVPLNKADYQDFYEKIYRLHCISNGFSYQESDNYCIVNIPNGLSLRLVDEKYSHVLDEIFVERVYDLIDVNSKIVIDIGASIGDSAIYFASRGALVYAYEADDERFDNATYNIAINNLQNKIFLQKRSIDSNNEIVEICSKNVKTDVFLKIDCEGCEHQILKNKLPSNVLACVLEYHGESKTLIDSLKSQGFRCKIRKEIIYAVR
jgi:hypothetical protein